MTFAMWIVFVLVISVQIASAQTVSALAQSGVEYVGELNAEIIATDPRTSWSYKVASTEERAKLPMKLADSDQVFVEGLYYWKANGTSPTPIIIVEPAKGEPSVYVDVDMSGKFEAAERFTFYPVKNGPSGMWEALLKLPLKDNSSRFYPIKVGLSNVKPKTEKGRLVTLSNMAYVSGVVDIDGRKTIVQYRIDENGKVNPTNGWLGIDSDGDGKIDMSGRSPECALAKRETVIFRVGTKYVSTKIVDPTTRKIILISHSASEYDRIELALGNEIPDFSFTDLDGKSRKLSDFRGKYVLLDFWGTWCGPCVGEIPHLKEAYTKYRSRGFEIIGMDKDTKLDVVKTFVAEKGITWPQATTESILTLLDKRFRITNWPTTILLDPQGKIISLDQPLLRGRGLLDTLEKILPAKSN